MLLAFYLDSHQAPCRLRLAGLAAVLATAAVVAALFPSMAGGQSPRNPLSKSESVALLRNSVPASRIEHLARQYGTSFELTPETEKELRTEGASEALLNALRELAPAAPARSVASPVLVVQTTPGGAQVYVDDELVGTASAEGRVKVSRLPPGEHRVRVSHPGYQDFEQNLALEAGESVRIIAKLEALKPAAPESPATPPGTSKPASIAVAEKDRAAFEQIAQRVSPAVVHVRVFEPMREPGARPVAGLPTTRQQTTRALGSGVMVSPDGYIVTNHHIIGKASEVDRDLSWETTYWKAAEIRARGQRVQHGTRRSF